MTSRLFTAPRTAAAIVLALCALGAWAKTGDEPVHHVERSLGAESVVAAEVAVQRINAEPAPVPSVPELQPQEPPDAPAATPEPPRDSNQAATFARGAPLRADDDPAESTRIERAQSPEAMEATLFGDSADNAEPNDFSASERNP
jgi:hypothetical protein